MSRIIGIIGGSGLYDLQGMEQARFERVTSPFGQMSDEVCHGRIGDVELVFLPRHGRGHRLNPSEVNYRANIDGLKRLGVTDIVSLSACGSLREDLSPGTFVLVDQFIDRTIRRAASFFEDGIAAHVSLADPTCAGLRGLILAAGEALDLPIVDGGTYLVMEGPQFSTRAESELYRSIGAHVIGMTNMPEARLAREAEICYQTVAMVTDYDCWHDDHGDVDVARVIRVLNDNAEHARALVSGVIVGAGARLEPCPAGCNRALDNAVITAPDARSAKAVSRLDAVAGRIFGGDRIDV